MTASRVLGPDGQPWVPDQRHHGAMRESFRNADRGRMRPGNRGPLASTRAHRDSKTLEDLVRDCQQLSRNDPIAGSIMSARATAIVGSDPVIEIGSDDPDWNEEMEERFEEWADSQADVTRSMTFGQMACAIVNRWDDSGGVLVNKIVKGSGRSMRCKLEMIDVLRLVNPNRTSDTPTTQGGVEVSEYTGAAIGYYIGEWDKQGRRVIPAKEYTDASNIWMLNNPSGHTPGQHRVEPMLNRVIDRIERVGQASGASFEAYIISAMIALFVKRTHPGGPTLNEQIAQAHSTVGSYGGKASDPRDEPDRGTWEGGAVLEGQIGEEIDTISPSHPSTAYDQMMWAELQIVFAAMDLPSELVAMRFLKSFHASRSAISVGWQRIEMYQRALERRFLKPVYRWWAANEILSGRIREVKGWRRCQWYLPVMPVLDRKAEIEASLLELSGSVGLHRNVIRRLGNGRRSQFIKQWLIEQQQNEEAGLKFARPINQIESQSVNVEEEEVADA